ncbi:MAG: CpaD family pilus assembly protein [Pseudomonadota bacterium]
MMRLILLLASGLLATACATAPEPLPRAGAVAETVRVEMAVDPLDNGLTWAQQDLIASVASEFKSRGHGPLVISHPDGGPNQEAIIQAIANARTQLYGHGLDWRRITGGAYESRGYGGPVVFSFTRYRATAEDCDTGWDNLARQKPGAPWEGFGCSTAANLAAMVADPRDLITPRTFDAPDAQQRQRVLDGWRSGENTGSDRSESERAIVSDDG